jgi:hypothetical protein
MSSESKYVKDASVLPVTWLKGSASQGNDQCVEIGSAGDAVFIRSARRQGRRVRRDLTAPA